MARKAQMPAQPSSLKNFQTATQVKSKYCTILNPVFSFKSQTLALASVCSLCKNGYYLFLITLANWSPIDITPINIAELSFSSSNLHSIQPSGAFLKIKESYNIASCLLCYLKTPVWLYCSLNRFGLYP